MLFVLETLFLILTGIILLRISGRKSISQMTIATTVVMISIGTIIVQPIIEDSIFKTVAAASIFIIVLLLIEYLKMKFDFFESLIAGKAVVLIENGELQKQNLKKHRLTVDQLEMRLRTQGISKLSDVKNVTLESNGQIGYELSDDAKPFTMGEYKKFLRMQNNLQQPEDNLFKEINEGHLHEPDKQLR
ncbi:DUF421 domain-containing protein [Bacillus paralicheniformis]|jgi:uncharacterized membrane protein YcaP (DUF421 family)|uniref:DUF421 domain-containing protein n=1 Tax=Bacillus paralicheniformis TaxID=1648923 RepID=A0A6I7TJH8_9BACI|nr:MULTISPECIES: DUF421 domain-containing protein [Bacillus]KUL09885.1 hypothetical protein LI7559_10840 [Bacillus licheniformis LMG 7559]MBC8621059.1 DUF421 domain-containing protein [Robertmurraya crescens]POO78521.1 DUF421 domain-containing protein [Bacillus sp. MBGLi97]AGN37706.1 DUF421 transmembrane protein YdfR [Bacillus paralicheniformis ATCC 9945a]AYQ17776.1 DUF421 domain-containing protein [Bacillus paralicheniformis]